MAAICVDQHPLILCLMDMLSLLLKISLTSCFSKKSLQRSVAATKSSSYCDGVFLRALIIVVISSLVTVMLSSFSYVRSKQITTPEHVVSLVVFTVKVTLVATSCFIRKPRM